MQPRRRPAPHRPLVAVALAAAVPVLAGCGGSDGSAATVTGPVTVVSADRTQTRVVTTDGAAATPGTTTAAPTLPPLHGVERRSAPDDDPADRRATDRVIEELHERGRIERLGIVQLSVAGRTVLADTSRPARAVSACRAIRAAAVARGLEPLQGVSVLPDDPTDDGTALYLEGETEGCERR